MKFSLLLPTRKRVSKLKRLFKSIDNTISKEHDILVPMYIDEDDKETIQFVKSIDNSDHNFDIDYWVMGRDRRRGGRMFNYLWEQTNADIYQMINDDIIYKTNNWDKEIVKEVNKFEDNIVFIYGNNMDNNYPNHFFTTDTVTNILGYFCWDETPGWHTEKWIYFIFKILKHKLKEDRMVFREDIKIPHLSPLHSDTEPDEVWERGKRIREEYDINEMFGSEESKKRRLSKAKELKQYIEENE